jgi:hypothetical protein
MFIHIKVVFSQYAWMGERKKVLLLGFNDLGFDLTKQSCSNLCFGHGAGIFSLVSKVESHTIEG